MRKTVLLVLALLLNLHLIFSQEQENQQFNYPVGISFKLGFGNYSIKDEFISKEKYSGNNSILEFSWSKFKNNDGYRISFQYSKTTDLKNNNISAEGTQIQIDQDYFYNIGKFSLFSKDVTC